MDRLAQLPWSVRACRCVLTDRGPLGRRHARQKEDRKVQKFMLQEREWQDREKRVN